MKVDRSQECRCKWLDSNPAETYQACILTLDNKCTNAVDAEDVDSILVGELPFLKLYDDLKHLTDIIRTSNNYHFNDILRLAPFFKSHNS